MEEHAYWMSLCIELGKQAMQEGNAPVGSILIKDKQIIGRGIEAGKSKRDITCHAEIEAIRDALQKGQGVDMQDCTLYTTHEPCIMCSYVIRHHRISTVIMGIEVAAIGGCSSPYPILQAENISIWPAPPIIITGVLKEQCELLNNDFRSKPNQKG
jgi:tRNA(adenine34) deaminase